MCASTSRAFDAGTRTKRAVARVLIAGSRLARRRSGGLLRRPVRLERAGQRKLAEPVAHHVLRDVHRNELSAVVHGQRVADELRQDGRPPRPGLQDLFLARSVQLFDAALAPLLVVLPLPPRSSDVPPLVLRPARDDVAIRRPRAPPRLIPLGRPAPRRHRMIALALALAAPHRVIDGIHDGAADSGAKALPADAPGLAHRDVFMVEIADLADRGHAVELDPTDLARGQLDVGLIALLGEELRQRARAPAQLSALARLELDVVDERAERDVAKREGIARQDVGLGPGHDRVARLEPERRDDVALLAVAIEEQGEAGRAVRIVLDRLHDRRHAELLAAEV